MAGRSGDVVYHGYHQSGKCLIMREAPDGTQLGPLKHWVRHSPAGFSWGYGGSGPSDTARSLLLDALETPWCLECDGHGKVYSPDGGGERPFDPQRDDLNDPHIIGCADCDSGDGLRLVPYVKFKWEAVAGWPQDQGWRVSRSEVRAWLIGSGVGTGSTVGKVEQP